MFKKLIAALICLTLIMTPTVFSTPVEASPPSGITPLWDIANSVILGMDYANGTVSWFGNISGGPNCYSIAATFTLYQNNGIAYNSTAPTVIGRTLYHSGSYVGGPGTYKLCVDAVITSTTGATEIIHQEITRTYY